MNETPVTHPHVMRMQNPVRMIYKPKGSVRTIYGPVTKIRYRFGGRLNYTWVDERDVLGFRNYSKNPWGIFAKDPNQDRDEAATFIKAPEADRGFEEFLNDVAPNVKTEVMEERLIEEDEVELSDVAKEQPEHIEEVEAEAFNFTKINGIGLKGMEYLVEANITTAEQLYSEGVGFLATIPYVNEDKANDIFEQLEDLIKQE